MPSLEVTLGSGATQVSPKAVYCSFITGAVPATAHQTNFGDSTVSATKGIPVSAGSSYTMAIPTPIGRLLSALWLYGTSGDVIQVDYEPV